MVRLIVIGLVLFFFARNSWSQEVGVVCQNKPLNEVLVELRDNYQIQFSFNDSELSNYKITLNKSFGDPESAIDFLLTDLPLSYELQHGVFLIYSDTHKQKSKNVLLAGQVIDKYSSEPLPFTHLVINTTGLISDFKGCFSLNTNADSIYNIRVSYLGYYILDTIVQASNDYKFKLKPSSVELKEVIIEGKLVEFSTQVGSAPGAIRLNHKIAAYLPGNGDNSVFNLLRLQPGILASSEQSSELIIWGSYDGQNHALFDGFSIFKLKNYHDNISAVNPFMAKDIKVLKGGYDAKYGEQVGGIVNISGINGSYSKPQVKLSVNNLTINGMVSVPIFKKSALVVAYRKTYYNLYEPFIISNRQNSGSNSPNNNLSNVTATPDYDFYDFNMKYSGSINNRDSYFVSFFRGKDEFAYSIDEEGSRVQYINEKSEENKQIGAAAFFGKLWKNGGRSNLTLSYSGIETNFFTYEEVSRLTGNNTNIRKLENSFTSRNTAKVKFDNYFTLSNFHSIEVGAGLEDNAIELFEDSFDIVTTDEQESSQLANVYINDIVSVNKKLNLTLGVRMNYPINLNKVYAQPRISSSLKLSETIKLNAAWGLYNQFVTKSPSFDSLNNYNYFWTISNNEDVPVLKSNHYVLGLLYSKNNLQISLEGYIRNTTGISMYFQNQFIRSDIYQGDSRSKGIDFFIKKDYRGHSAWISYSLSKTEERFPITVQREGSKPPVYIGDSYIPALHDQRHEVKVAGLFRISPFYLSFNYVYGSGFPERRQLLQSTAIYGNLYSRLDAALIYKFNTRRINLETGLSFLNVLNTNNTSYSIFSSSTVEHGSKINIQTESIPFTPTIFINLSF